MRIHCHGRSSACPPIPSIRRHLGNSGRLIPCHSAALPSLLAEICCQQVDFDSDNASSGSRNALDVWRIAVASMLFGDALGRWPIGRAAAMMWTSKATGKRIRELFYLLGVVIIGGGAYLTDEGTGWNPID